MNHTSTPFRGALSAQTFPIESLKPDARNPRIHTPRQIRQIARSIKSFGFNAPILIDRNNKVVAGHGRLLAARLLEWQEVPVIRLEHLTELQARAFAIADNKLTDNSSWNDTLLGEIFLELSALDLDFDFDIEDTGFSMGEIDLAIEGLSAEHQPDAIDQIPAIPDHPPICRPGDLWTLGSHRILCGNALDSTAFDTLMQGAQAQLIFTDPPYNVRINGHASGNGMMHHREFPMAAGEMSEGEFTDFLTQAFKLLCVHSVPGSIHFICIDWRHIFELMVAGKSCYSDFKNMCIWSKDRAGMGSLYRSQHELIFVFKNGNAPHLNNIQLGQYGRNRTNVWSYPSASTLSRKPGEENLLALHPTVKPVALIADAILDCSARGDIVLDSFLGSGSTLLAAERVGRVCYGIELDCLYVDTAIRRWQTYTGQYAVHAASGKPFDELSAGTEVGHEQ